MQLSQRILRRISLFVFVFFLVSTTAWSADASSKTPAQPAPAATGDKNTGKTVQKLKNPKTNADTIDVEADNMKANKKTGDAVFTGNVIGKQGDMTVRCDTLKIYYDEKTKKASRFIATVNPGTNRLVRIHMEDKDAESKKAEYFYDLQKLILSEKVIVTKADGKINCERFVVDQLNETQNCEGQGGRVKLKVKTDQEAPTGIIK